MADDKKIETAHLDQANGGGYVDDKDHGPDSYARDAERQGSRSQSVSLNRNVTARYVKAPNLLSRMLFQRK